jgi:hypothetical protein
MLWLAKNYLCCARLCSMAPPGQATLRSSDLVGERLAGARPSMLKACLAYTPARLAAYERLLDNPQCYYNVGPATYSMLWLAELLQTTSKQVANRSSDCILHTADLCGGYGRQPR